MMFILQVTSKMMAQANKWHDKQLLGTSTSRIIDTKAIDFSLEHQRMHCSMCNSNLGTNLVNGVRDKFMCMDLCSTWIWRWWEVAGWQCFSTTIWRTYLQVQSQNNYSSQFHMCLLLPSQYELQLPLAFCTRLASSFHFICLVNQVGVAPRLLPTRPATLRLGKHKEMLSIL